MTSRTVPSRQAVETAAGPKTERKSRKDRAKAAAALKKQVIDMSARDSKAALPAINYDDLSTIQAKEASATFVYNDQEQTRLRTQS